MWLATMREWVDLHVNVRQDIPRFLDRNSVRDVCPTVQLQLELLLAAGLHPEPGALEGAAWAVVHHDLDYGKSHKAREDCESQSLMLLLALGSCDATSSDGSRCLAIAASYRLWKLVDLLVSCGADPNASILGDDQWDRLICFPLFQAAAKGNLPVVQTLICRGCRSLRRQSTRRCVRHHLSGHCP